MKNDRIKKALKLVDQIEKIRSRNNKNWMDLLRISLKFDFKKTSKVLEEICKHDHNIHKLAKKISKIKD